MVRARKPRGNHGGPRQGAPGQTYTNRGDLNQAPRAVPDQPYGVAGQQLASQQAVPLPTAQGPSGGMPGGGGGQSPSSSPSTPLPPPLDAPTARPDEPLTTGLPTGPGAGPEALGINAGPPEDPTLATLKGILAKFPNADIQALVAQASAAHP